MNKVFQAAGRKRSGKINEREQQQQQQQQQTVDDIIYWEEADQSRKKL
jgi:hypothetical protein